MERDTERQLNRDRELERRNQIETKIVRARETETERERERQRRKTLEDEKQPISARGACGGKGAWLQERGEPPGTRDHCGDSALDAWHLLARAPGHWE